MKVLENIISVKKEGIDDAESEALIGLRKEFIRRSLAISSLSIELNDESE